MQWRLQIIVDVAGQVTPRVERGPGFYFEGRSEKSEVRMQAEVKPFELLVLLLHSVR
jgi:hypothetical protein